MSEKRIIPKELLENLYIDQSLPIQTIARKLSSSTHTISRNLDDHDIPRRAPGALHKKHGMSDTRQYHIWQQMKNRCSNPNHGDFHKYGAKGVTYQDSWETFMGFWNDMSEGYSDSKTIDRIDGSGNYTKNNCRWIDYKGQNRNKSDNVLLAYQGKTQCIAAWSKEVSIHQSTLYDRKKAGWTDEDILTLPPQTVNK